MFNIPKVSESYLRRTRIVIPQRVLTLGSLSMKSIYYISLILICCTMFIHLFLNYKIDTAR